MAHGTPDWWGMTPKKTTVFAAIDMAELAVRLGSIVTFDRLGDVVYADDFEGSFEKYTTWSIGTGALVERTSRTYRSKTYSARLRGGSDDERFARIATGCVYQAPSKLGFEISFAGVDYVTTEYIQIYIRLNAPTGRFYAGIRYDCYNEQLYFLNSADAWQAFGDMFMLIPIVYVFNTLKFVIDPDTQKYVRCRINHLTFPMTQNFYRWGNPTEVGSIDIQLEVKSVAGYNATVFFDDLIVTQNEP